MIARPLSDRELERLSALLQRFRSPEAMTLEEVDGFFAALICGPEMVLPSAYLPDIWGGEMTDEDAFDSREEMKEFLDLLFRHWQAVANILHTSRLFLPLLSKDDDGVAHGNEWARGFVRGMEYGKDAWLELLDDEDRGGLIVPMFALATEHHSDPEMRPWEQPIDAAKREEVLVAVAACVPGIYRYFSPHRRRAVKSAAKATTVRRSAPKHGRNAPCPCGSGKKFKQCCGMVTLH